VRKGTTEFMPEWQKTARFPAEAPPKEYATA
jgi:hypothetical protein